MASIPQFARSPFLANAPHGDPMPTSLDLLPAWIARHYAPELRAGIYARLAPQVKARAAAPRGTTAPAPVPAPPAPVAPPVSYGQEAGIQSIQDRLNAQTGIYNPQRQALYTEGARGLTDQGYFDVATPGVTGTAADGSVSYGVTGSAEGRLFRDSRMGVQNAANARGAFYSSARRNAEALGQKQLSDARDAILRGLAANQDTITANQASSVTDLRGQLGTAQGDYADWRAQQVVPAPPASPSAAPAAAGGGTARWKVKPKAFATVQRGGWWYRA